MTRTLTLPAATQILLGDDIEATAWNAAIDQLGTRTSGRALAVLAIVAILSVASAIYVAMAIASANMLFWSLAIVLLALAALVLAAWRLAPHHDWLVVLIGKPLEPPARVAALRQALLKGRLEAALPGHSASDPSLFSGQLWPLQFSRSDRFRRRVRAPDGHRALGLLTLDHDQFDAWRRLEGWIEPAEDEDKPAAEVPVPLAVQMPFRPLKSLCACFANSGTAISVITGQRFQ